MHWTGNIGQNYMRSMNSSGTVRQFCSALEFSGQDKNTVFVPYWMMQNIKVRNGSDITLKSVLKVPSGESTAIQPEDDSFFDILSVFGPQEFLENKMKNYSVLSKGERILVMHESKKFYIKIVETAPKDAISILGDVDLTVDFVGGEDYVPKVRESAGNEIGEALIAESFHEEVQHERENERHCELEDERENDVQWAEENEPDDCEFEDPWEEPERKIEKVTIDQEDPEIRRKRMREAALKRYEKLLV